MTAVAERIFKEALTLPPTDRAELISQLFHSFDQSHDRSIDEAWIKETESRFEAYDRGEVKGYSMEEVMNRINNR